MKLLANFALLILALVMTYYDFNSWRKHLKDAWMAAAGNDGEKAFQSSKTAYNYLFSMIMSIAVVALSLFSIVFYLNN